MYVVSTLGKYYYYKYSKNFYLICPTRSLWFIYINLPSRLSLWVRTDFCYMLTVKKIFDFKPFVLSSLILCHNYWWTQTGLTVGVQRLVKAVRAKETSMKEMKETGKEGNSLQGASSLCVCVCECVHTSEGGLCVEWVGASLARTEFLCSALRHCALLIWVETSCVCGTPRGTASLLHTQTGSGRRIQNEFDQKLGVDSPEVRKTWGYRGFFTTPRSWLCHADPE